MSNYVKRFSAFDRVVHWVLAVAFFVLVLSGLGLFAHTFFNYFDFFGGPQQGILAHKIAGIVFLITSILLFLAHAKDTCSFDSDDSKWFSAFGGYLSKEKTEIPQGKFNAGQKLFALFSIIAALVLGVTGVVIWDPTAMARGLTQMSLMLHGLFFVLIMMGAVVHIYLATIGNPGTVDGMLWGNVKKIWAKKHASKWYKEVAGDD
jgi:formate dehydrogenase subunit gamma